MEEKIVIDRATLKAIVVDTRLDILKLLAAKRYTLSEIAGIIGIRQPTAKEHLDILVKANLISKEQTDRKWKYYSLTLKGRMIVQPTEIRMMFVFGITVIAAGVSAWKYLSSISQPMLAGGQILMTAAPAALSRAAEKTAEAAAISAPAQPFPWALALMILFAVASVALLITLLVIHNKNKFRGRK